MSVNENKAIIRRVFDEIWRKGNLSVVDEIYAKSLVYYGAPSTGAVFRGPDGYRQLCSLYRSAFPDIHFTIEEMVGEGDMIAVSWTGHGTHKGVLNGIAPTGRQVANPGVSIVRFASGKIVEERATWDERHLYKSLGVNPPA